MTWTSNDWHQRWVEDEYTPELRVSVVVPAYNNQDQLDAVLTALEAQTYPRSLTQVIVADDGSDPVLTVTGSTLDTEIVRLVDMGYRLAAARNLGATRADGDVLVFLDSDMLPEPTWLWEHMRVHHHSSWAVVCGPRRHVAPLPVRSEAVRELGVPQIFTGLEFREPGWLVHYWLTTNDGRDDPSSLWRVTSGGNISMPKKAFLAVGGFNEEYFREWGGEDNDLGYRLYQAGCFIVPGHKAMAWHIGWGTSAKDDSQELRQRNRRRLSVFIPDPGLPVLGVQPVVPWMWIRLHPSDVQFERLVEFVASALKIEPSVAISIKGKPSNRKIKEAELLFRSDSRVAVEPINHTPMEWRSSRIRLTTAYTGWTAEDLSAVQQLVGEGAVGRLDVIHDGGGRSTASLSRLVGQIRAGTITASQIERHCGFLVVAHRSLTEIESAAVPV